VTPGMPRTPETPETSERDRALRSLAEAWLGLRRVTPDGTLTIERAEVLLPGRPGLLDIVARVRQRQAHVVVGLRGVTDEPHFLRSGEEAALGLLDDEHGLAVCTDALRDTQLAPLLLATLRNVPTCPGPVAVLRDDEDATVIDCGDRGDLTVFPWLADAPRPDVDVMVALDEVGFNHVAAPLVRWVWQGSDLGVVQEPLADRSGGWALAMTSLRDFYASRGSPEAAGGDFGDEARALGTMTARMHLALDRAFLRHHEPVVDWVHAAEAEIAGADASLLHAPGVADLLKWLREAEGRLPVIRTHGDFQLSRTARTDQGWVLSDCEPGGVLAGSSSPGRRTPLADVADLLWSMHEATRAAAAERDPAGRLGLASLGAAWEARNRRCFMTGYVGTPGISGLVGPDRDLVRRLVSFLELARSVHAASD
jgi:predicted trehalose synthase